MKKRHKMIRVSAEKFMRTKAHRGDYLSTPQIIDYLMTTDVEVLNPRSFRLLLGVRLRSFLLERNPEGDRDWYPVVIDGSERWVPREHMDADRLRSYLINTDRPTLANHSRANRRREIELTILENEERLAGRTLTVDDVLPLAEQATAHPMV